MGLLQKPTSETFTAENICKAWKFVGIRPFTRKVEKQLMHEEREKEAAKRRASRSCEPLKALLDRIDLQSFVPGSDPDSAVEIKSRSLRVSGVDHKAPMTSDAAMAQMQERMAIRDAKKVAQLEKAKERSQKRERLLLEAQAKDSENLRQLNGMYNKNVLNMTAVKIEQMLRVRGEIWKNGASKATKGARLAELLGPSYKCERSSSTADAAAMSTPPLLVSPNQAMLQLSGLLEQYMNSLLVTLPKRRRARCRRQLTPSTLAWNVVHDFGEQREL
eukprot:scaffold1631_cov198-Pinguiococcus_pyrenoidosus.AAC.5